MNDSGRLYMRPSKVVNLFLFLFFYLFKDRIGFETYGMHSMIIVLYHQIKTLISLQHKKELKWMLNHVMKFFRERIEGDLSSPSMLMSCSPPHCCSCDCSLHADTLPPLSPPYAVALSPRSSITTLIIKPTRFLLQRIFVYVY
jgi:hypothetical protein